MERFVNLGRLGQALGLKAGDWNPILEGLEGWLQPRRTQWLFDNFEHPLFAARFVIEALERCADLKLPDHESGDGQTAAKA